MNTDSEGSRLDNFLEEAFDFKSITWRIPNFLSWRGPCQFWVPSSTFAFANAIWELRVYPFGGKKESNGYIDLAIVRKNSTIPKHHVLCKFCLKNQYGKECEIQYLSESFEHYPFGWTLYKYLHRSKLRKMKEYVPNGALTVICQLQTRKIVSIDRSSQMESNTSLSGLDRTTTSKLSAHISDKILDDFKKLFLQQEDYDVIIKVKEKEFPAHKLILRARSPVFASTFRNDMKEKSTGFIHIEDCDPDSFSIFLKFLYSGDLSNISVENVFILFTTSDKYDVQDLRKKCLEFIKENLSVDTFCDTIRLAVMHFDTELIKLSTDFFAKNLQDILVTVKWQVFLAENPTIANELLIKAVALNKSSK